MIVSCPECGTRFDVAERLLAPKGRTLRCSHCRAQFFQAPPPPAGEEEPVATPVAPAPAPAAAAPKPAAPPVAPAAAPAVEPKPAAAAAPKPAAPDPAATLVLSASELPPPSPIPPPQAPPSPAEPEGLDDLAGLDGMDGMEGLEGLEGLDHLGDLDSLLDGLDGSPDDFPDEPAAAPAAPPSPAKAARAKEPEAFVDLDAELGMGGDSLFDKEEPLPDLDSLLGNEPEGEDSLPDLDSLLGNEPEPEHTSPADGSLLDEELAGLLNNDLPSDENSDELLEGLEGLMDEPASGEDPELDALLREEGAMRRGGSSMDEDDLDALLAGVGDDGGEAGGELSEIDLSDTALLDGDEESLLASTSSMEEIDLDADTMPGNSANLNRDEEDALGSLGMAGANRLTGEEEDALANLGMGDLDEEPETLLSPAYHDDPVMEDDVPTQLAGAPAAMAAAREEPSSPRRRSEPPPKRRLAMPSFRLSPGVLSILLALLLAFSVAMQLPMVEAWRSGLKSTFKLAKVEGKWKKYPYGQVLMVTGELMNSSRLAQNMPFVKVSLLSDDNQELASNRVVPGRLLTDKDMESEEGGVRTLLELQAKEKGLSIPKALPDRIAPFQVIFINPVPEATRFRLEWEFRQEESKRTGGTKNFQSAF